MLARDLIIYLLSLDIYTTVSYVLIIFMILCTVLIYLIAALLSTGMFHFHKVHNKLTTISGLTLNTFTVYNTTDLMAAVANATDGNTIALEEMVYGILDTSKNWGFPDS